MFSHLAGDYFFMIYSLQILRLFAASLVVFEHAVGEFSSIRPFGYIGVDIFFVISGYVIGMSEVRSPKRFLIKRLIRIIPLYWLVSVFFLIAVLFVDGATSHSKVDWYYWFSSLFFFPVSNSQIEFYPFFKIGWSLNFEMLFYITFAVAMFVDRIRAVQISLFIIIVISTACYTAVDGDFNKSYLYLMEFCCGLLISKAWLRHRLMFDRTSNFTVFPPAFFLFLIFLTTFEYVLMLNGFLAAFLRWVVSSGWVLFALTISEKIPRRYIGVSNLAGVLSFPLYLLHPFVIGVVGFLLEDNSLFFGYLIVFSLSLFLSFVVDKYFDHPMKNNLRKALSH